MVPALATLVLKSLFLLYQIVECFTNSTVNISRPAGAILIQLVRAGPNSTGQIRNYGFRVVHEVLKSSNAYTKVVERVNEPDVETQKNSLVLLNSLFAGARGNEQNDFMDKLDGLYTRKTLMVSQPALLGTVQPPSLTNSPPISL